MNFLAHAVLSFEHPDLIVGNFIADFVKGRAYLDYPENVSKGILLHREIDHYTDQHPQFRNSKTRLSSEFGHYSGVIVDMYFDHFLAANFHRFHRRTLEEFSNHVYQTVRSFDGTIPAKADYILHHMSRSNWLLSYRKISGIDQALKGMSRRTKFRSRLEFAGIALRENYHLYYTDFMIFFPKVLSFAQEKIRKDDNI